MASLVCFFAKLLLGWVDQVLLDLSVSVALPGYVVFD